MASSALLELRPSVGGLHLLRADALTELERYSDAIKDYDRSIELE